MPKPWEVPIGEATEKKIIHHIKGFNNVRLLDFGAGYGRYLDMFAKYIEKRNLYGAEIDDESLNAIRRAGYNCYKPEFDNVVIPFNDSFFDYIFTSNVVEHIPNRFYKKYINEFYRVLKPGGVLIFGAPNYPFKRLYDIKKAFKTKQYRYYLLDDPTHCNKLSILQYERDFKRVFNEVKFEPTEIFFEKRFGLIKKNRYKLRIFGDKISGICIKDYKGISSEYFT